MLVYMIVKYCKDSQDHCDAAYVTAKKGIKVQELNPFIKTVNVKR